MNIFKRLLAFLWMKKQRVTGLSSEEQMDSQIKISPMPRELLQFLLAKKLTIPMMCFNNCFLAVMNDLTAQRFKIDYVLAWVKHPQDNVRTSHALLKSGNSFYDPTLEPQGIQGQCKYELEKVFSREELVKLLGEKFTPEQIRSMIDGKEPWWPLCEVGRGNYEFVDAPLPIDR